MARTVREVTGVADLKALSHPLRVRLLGALREFGPATATELAHRLGTDTGSTSYHLRKLADSGFIQAAEPTGTHARERRWQAAHELTSWNNATLAKTAEGREAIAAMRRRQVEVLARDVEHFEASITRLPPEWVEAAGIGDLLVNLTAASLTTLWNEFYARLDELAAADADNPDALRVSVVAAGFPRPLGTEPQARS